MAKKHTDPYRLYQYRGIWYAYIHFTRQDGQTVHFRGTTGTREKATAEKWVIEKINQAYQENPTPTTSITFETACVLFYERHGQYLSRPLEVLQRLNNLKNHLNIKNLSELSNPIISQMVETRKHEVANGTINRELMLLSSILNKCELWGYNVPRVKISQFKLKEKAEILKCKKPLKARYLIYLYNLANIDLFNSTYSGSGNGSILDRFEEIIRNAQPTVESFLQIRQ